MKNDQKTQEDEYGRQKVRLQDLIQLHQQNKWDCFKPVWKLYYEDRRRFNVYFGLCLFLIQFKQELRWKNCRRFWNLNQEKIKPSDGYSTEKKLKKILFTVCGIN